jgi:hypothetical protein
MGLLSCFLEKKFVEHEKGDDITPFDGMEPCPLVLLSQKFMERFRILFSDFQILY